MKWLAGREINRIAIPVTRRCNRACPECPAKANSQTQVDEFKWAGQMIGPIKTVEVTGGEPSIHPDFEHISEHIHEWFDSKDILLLTNGCLFENETKFPLLLHYDRIYISWYTNEFGIKYGIDPNTAVVNRIEDYCKRMGKPVWVQRMDSHVPIGKPPYSGKCMMGYDKSDSVGYLQGRVYGCCVSNWLDDHGTGIPLTRDWRDHLTDIELPCDKCFMSGEATVNGY